MNNNNFSFSDKVKTVRVGIFNNKGGVAKTTSVINIAHIFHKRGIKVLAVDCDTQENCFNFFTSPTIDGNVLPTKFENIKHTTWERYRKMTDSEFEKITVTLFDLPPTLSDEVREIIKHMDVIYVPTMVGIFEFNGLAKVTEEITKQGIKLGGIFITKYQNETDAELVERTRTILGNRLMKTIIPFSNTVRKSQMENLPLEVYFDTHNVPRIGNAWKVVNAYTELAEEIMINVMNIRGLKELA